MASSCADSVPAATNPGGWLGGGMGRLALQGGNKPTRPCSPNVATSGHWAEEQLGRSPAYGGGGSGGGGGGGVARRGGVGRGGGVRRGAIGAAGAGGSFGMDAFDQPNVQGSKDNAKRVLAKFKSAGKLPPGESTPGARARTGVKALIARAKPSAYFAIMAYTARTATSDAAIAAIRTARRRHTHIPTPAT